MAEIPEPDFERDLAAYLRRESKIPVPGLALRVAQRVRHQRQRSRIILWTSLSSALAACLVLAFVLQSEPTSLPASVVAQSSSHPVDLDSELDWLNGASDLKLITPLMNQQNSFVSEVLTSTDI